MTIRINPDGEMAVGRIGGQRGQIQTIGNGGCNIQCWEELLANKKALAGELIAAIIIVSACSDAGSSTAAAGVQQMGPKDAGVVVAKAGKLDVVVGQGCGSNLVAGRHAPVNTPSVIVGAIHYPPGTRPNSRRAKVDCGAMRGR